MCGRYAATANPDELTLEFEVDDDRTAEPARSVLANPQSPAARDPRPQHGPDQAGAGRPDPRAARRGRRAAPAPAAPAHLGARAQLVQGPEVRGADDQRARRVGRWRSRHTPRRRHAVAASSRRAGWYEWQASPTATDAKGKPLKQPFYTSRADGEPCAFAGLYEFWRDPAVADRDDPAAWLTTFTDHHDRGRAGPGPHPRPAAARPRPRRLGGVARPRG